MKVPDHRHRQALLSELHARPVAIVPERCRVRRIVLAWPDRKPPVSSLIRDLLALARQSGKELSLCTERQFAFTVGPKQVIWEFHTEFVSLTWHSSLDDKNNWPHDIGFEIATGATLVAGMRIDVISSATIPDRLIPGFSVASLCLSTVAESAAQVATDFVADEDGFTRIEFAAGELRPLKRSTIVRRLLEIETYRSMAMLGLPLAQAAAAGLDAVEKELGQLVTSIGGDERSASARYALEELHSLSARSTRLAELLEYRFAASRAYGAILRSRLSSLGEAQTSVGSTLSTFIGNRVDPALATCAAMEARLKRLSEKAERVAGLLNVKVGLDIQDQNSTVLHSIAQTASSHFRLQRTVEGLSIIAVSYYLVGIFSYALSGVAEQFHWNKALALSLMTPLIVMSVWLVIRNIRRLHAET